MAFHINPSTGEAGKCSATKGGCPFGSAEDHYSSPEAARNAFEETQAGSFEVSANETAALSKMKKLGQLSVTESGPGSIAYAMDFDHVLAKGSDNDFYEGGAVYAPDTSWIEDADKTDVGGGWELITYGMTGQQGYSGPWLHSSEQIADGVAQKVADGKPGYYVSVVGSGPDSDEDRAYDDETGEPIEIYDEEPEPVDVGWAIAYKPFDTK